MPNTHLTVYYVARFLLVIEKQRSPPLLLCLLWLQLLLLVLLLILLLLPQVPPLRLLWKCYIPAFVYTWEDVPNDLESNYQVSYNCTIPYTLR